MKTFLRIKWENIMVLTLFATTIYGWVVYASYCDDTKVLALASITTFMYLMSLISYESIKNVRQETLKLWN